MAAAALPAALQSEQDAIVVRHRPDGVTKPPSTLEYGPALSNFSGPALTVSDLQIATM
jgi:hypothetical protein